MKYYNRHIYTERIEPYINKKMTEVNKIDFIKFREIIANGKALNDELFGEILPKLKDCKV